MQSNIPLSRYTFTHTGGNAQYLSFPTNIKELKSDVHFAHIHKLPITVIGNASNLIINDKGLRGLTIILTKLNSVTIENNLIVADAGYKMIDLSVLAQRHGLSGLAYCAGLPGTVGGAEFMNASAYNESTGAVTQSVTVMMPNGKLRTFNHHQLNFGYRKSIFQKYPQWIILQATFKLIPKDKNRIQSLMDNFNAQRMAKQPLNYPSCGSVFRRPKGYYVGQLIHDCHLQGYQSGGAKVSNTHAGFIINVNHATATDYLNVIHHVQAVVYQKYKIKLHTEVKILR